jgi:hypothetical protein
MDRIHRSWRLARASLAVLAADKELMVFPIFSFLATTLVTVTMLWPAYALGLVGNVGDGEAGGGNPLGYVILFLYYVVLYTISVFSNSALVGMALMRLDGGDPTVGDGFRVAAGRARVILGYAVVAATVGVALSLVRQRAGAAGRAVAGIGGLAWNLATFLVVPVLVVDGCGPIEAVRRSAGLLRRTWGEQIVGGAGLGLVFFLLSLGAVGVAVLLFIVAAQLESAVLIVMIALALLATLLGLALVNSALHAIYAAALYRYAERGDAGAYFEADLVTNAFRAR